MEVLKLWILIIATLGTITMGNPTGQSVDKSENEIEKNGSDLNISSFAKCSYEGGFTGLINCAATRALKIIQHAENTETFEILPGVALTSENPQIKREGKAIKDEQLPSDPKQKTEKLMSLILDAASRFLSSRTLKIQIPKVSAAGIARTFEMGRKQMKKGGISPLILGLGAKAILFKGLLLAGLGLMAVKALFLSKIALVIAVVLGVQSLFGSGLNLKNSGGTPYFGGHGWISGWSNNNHGNTGPAYGTPTYPGWTTNSIGGWGNSQYPYARSIDNVKDEADDSRTHAQELAYSQQKP